MQTTTDILARATVSATALANLIATSTVTHTETYGGGCGTVERRYYAAGFSVDVFGDTMVLRPGLAWREALASRDEGLVGLYLAATGCDTLACSAADAGLQLRALASHKNPVVRWRVACHRECPSDVLAGLAEDINRRVVWAAINNDACPVEAVALAANLPPERRPNTGFPSIVVDDQLAVRAREILAARSVA